MNVSMKPSNTSTTFRSLIYGKIFFEEASGEVYMKLDTCYDLDREDYNAVNLRNGELTHFGDNEKVMMPKREPELVIEY